MKKILLKLSALLFIYSASSGVAGMGADDPLLFYVKADKLEWRDADEGNLLVWEIDAWLGKDLNKLWLKSSGESLDGKVEGHSIDLLYSRAISAFWDVQVGLRHELKPKPQRNWVGVGFMGVAPYLFEMDVNLFINDDSQANLRLDAEYEYMFTQKVILVPNLELSLYSDEDVARGIRSGLSSAELGLRLHYQIRREFSPYIGINLEKQFGNGAIESSSETQLVVGLSFWF
ncbi:MAG: copper resistance protein B [Gammaproteobacteria bacterium]|nr:copper resistance protein B [Gammaproteobacteria bacterium]